MGVTIGDVARAAGVSKATVSRAFSDPTRVARPTLSRILQAAKELGYEVARDDYGFETQLSGLVEIVVSDIANPVSSEYIRGVQSYCAEHNYGVVIADAAENSMSEQQIIKRSLKHVDALIFASSRMSGQVVRYVAQKRPTVVLNRLVNGVPSILVDSHIGIKAALASLQELGHRQVTYLSGPEHSYQNSVRKNTIKHVSKTLNIKVRALSGKETEQDGYFREFLKCPTSAVIAFNDLLALRFIAQCQRQNIAVPGQVSVLGFDSIPLASCLTPRLASIAYPAWGMGYEGAYQVIARLRGLSSPQRKHSFPSTWKKRESVGPANPLLR